MIIEKLARKVQEWGGFDKDQFNEIAEHGAGAGWSGFTYYNDTIKFYEQNETLIWKLLDEQADEMGTTAMKMISGFRCAQSVTDENEMKNCLSWYALEESAYYVAQQEEDE